MIRLLNAAYYYGGVEKGNRKIKKIGRKQRYDN